MVKIQRHQPWKELLQQELFAGKRRKFTTTLLILWVLFFANILWVIDAGLASNWRPHKVLGFSEEVTHRHGNLPGERQGSVRVYLLPEQEVMLDRSEAALIPSSGEVECRITPIFNIVSAIRMGEKDSEMLCDTLVSLYFPFFFFPLISGLAALCGLLIVRFLPNEELIEFKFGVLSLIFYLLSILMYRIC